MQSSDVTLLTSIRLLLFLILLLLIYITTKQSSGLIKKAWRLPIIYPNDNEESISEAEERRDLLKSLSTRWSLFTIIDYSLGALIAYEIIIGFSAAESGMAYYFGVHFLSAVVISFGIGLFLAIVAMKFRNPFQSGRIQPLQQLVKNLESLVKAVHADDDNVSEDTEVILVRIVKQEIEKFIDFRQLGDAECGRLLEYLAGLEGTVGRAASAILWP
ncbi:MAG: hypothetical protein ACFFAX_08650 [Promethearchaeota archaeon]